MADAPLWLQALGPLATIAAAGSASYVAWRIGKAQVRINDAQREIAASQRDIAKRRMQMDLHDKRYEVLTALHDLMHLAFDERRIDTAHLNKLRRTVQEGQFFFPASAFEDIRQAEMDCVELHVFGSVADAAPEIVEKRHNAAIRTAERLGRWPAPFSEVMTFRDVE